MKSLITALVFSYMSMTVSAQLPQFEWVAPFGGPGYEVGSSIALDGNRAIVAAGVFNNTVDFDAGPGEASLTSLGVEDIYITKYDTGGVFMWVKQLAGPGYNMANQLRIDHQGNIVVVGVFQGTIDMDPGPAVFELSSPDIRIFVLKLDNDGNFIWAKKMGPNDGTRLTIDPSDNILIGGAFSGDVDFDPGPAVYMASTLPNDADLFILKLDPDGNFLWMKRTNSIGISDYQFGGLETDGSNNIYFSGCFKSTIDFDPGPGTAVLTSNGAEDGFILKLNEQGDFVWVKSIGGTLPDKVFDLIVDDAGNVYTTGQFVEYADLDPGAGTHYLTGPVWDASCFILKLDKDGNFIYAQNIEQSSQGWSLALDISQNVYLLGTFAGTADLNPGPGTYIVSHGSIFTLKLDPNGNFLWVAAYIGNGGGFYNDLQVDIFKNVYFTDAFTGPMDFDPNAPVYTVPNKGSSDAFLHKISQCINTANTIVIDTCRAYTLNNITYLKTGTYFQAIPKNNGCDSIIELKLTVNSSQVFHDNVVTCKPYTWNNVLFSSNGIYRDTLTSFNGCDSIVELDLKIEPIVSHAAIQACEKYVWNNNLFTESGTYSETFLLPGGCDSVSEINLIIHPLPGPMLGGDTSICKESSLTLKPGNFLHYQWSNGNTRNSIVVKEPGSYWVKVSDNFDCSASDTINITTLDACVPFAIPNAFTPNNDGRNDHFKPTINAAVNDYRFTIFNRYGQQVYLSTDPGKGWDGSFRNLAQPSGGFVYMIQYKKDGVPFLHKGAFLLIR